MLQQLFAAFACAPEKGGPQVSDPADPRLEHVSFSRIKKYLREHGFSAAEMERANTKFVLCMHAQQKEISLEPLLAECMYVITKVYAVTADINQKGIITAFRAPVTKWAGLTEYGTYTAAEVGLFEASNSVARDAALDQLTLALTDAKHVGVPADSLKAPNALHKALAVSKKDEYAALKEAQEYAATTTAKNTVESAARRISERDATVAQVVSECAHATQLRAYTTQLRSRAHKQRVRAHTLDRLCAAAVAGCGRAR